MPITTTPNDSRAEGGPNPGRVALWCTAVALMAVVVGLGVRLWGLDDRILSHPENFAPGIDMPDWVSRPVERTTLGGVLVGTLADGHPPLYFIAMLPWVKAFGVGLTALRLPSVLLGVASIWVLYLIGRRERDPRPACLAAALLALHGFHVYWSQMARMYVAAGFLMLLSTLLLYRCLDRGRLGTFIGYGVTTVAALWTQLYAWPVLAAQMIWVAGGILAGARRTAALRTQILALVAGAPVVQLAMYQDPASRWQRDASPYFGFGYLFDSKLPFWSERPWMPEPTIVLLFGATMLAIGVMAAVAGRRQPSIEAASTPTSLRWLDWVFAALVAILMLVAASEWYGGETTLRRVAVLPLGLLALGRIGEAALPRLGASLQRFGGVASVLRRIPLSAVLAVLPAAMMMAVSAKRGVFVARGTILFLPFLLLTVAYGLWFLIAHSRPIIRAAGATAAVAIAFLWGTSILFKRAASSSPRDYAAMARAIETRIAPNDLVLVRDDYSHQPLYYYLDRQHDPQLVYRDFEAAIATRSSVWVVRFCGQRVLPEIQSGLSTMSLREVVPVHNGELQRYESTPSQHGGPPVVVHSPVDPRADSFGCGTRPIDLAEAD